MRRTHSPLCRLPTCRPSRPHRICGGRRACGHAGISHGGLLAAPGCVGRGRRRHPAANAEIMCVAIGEMRHLAGRQRYFAGAQPARLCRAVCSGSAGRCAVAGGRHECPAGGLSAADPSRPERLHRDRTAVILGRRPLRTHPGHAATRRSRTAGRRGGPHHRGRQRASRDISVHPGMAAGSQRGPIISARRNSPVRATRCIRRCSSAMPACSTRCFAHTEPACRRVPL